MTESGRKQRRSGQNTRDKPVRESAVLAMGLATCLLSAGDLNAQTDPLSTLKAAFAAQNAGDVAATLAFYADDAVLINTRGARFTGKESVRRFIQANVDHKVRAHVENLAPEVNGEGVRLTDQYTTEFFERWGVRYVEFKTDVVIRDAKIKSQINYITFDGLLKIKRACNTPQGRTVVAGISCDDFLRRAMAQTERVLGSAAKAAWVPRVAGLKPYTDETNGMSLAGYLRYALQLTTGKWISNAEAERLVSQQRSP